VEKKNCIFLCSSILTLAKQDEIKNTTTYLARVTTTTPAVNIDLIAVLVLQNLVITLKK